MKSFMDAVWEFMQELYFGKPDGEEDNTQNV